MGRLREKILLSPSWKSGHCTSCPMGRAVLWQQHLGAVGLCMRELEINSGWREGF